MNRSFTVSSDLDPTWVARVAAIAADHRSGASTLTPKAIQILIDAHRMDTDTVDAVAAALCTAQPAMASVWNAAAVAVGDGGLDAIQRLATQVQRAPEALSRLLTDLLLTRACPRDVSGPLVVATVSASESVRVCLEALCAQTELRVICAEARPLMEGRQIATELAGAGVPTTVCTDVGIGAVIEGTGAQLEAVVVGADAVASRWFVNKCGTRQLVDVAASLGVPSYVVASRDKFIHEVLADELRPNQGPTDEVWADPPRGVTVANPYFERIPVESVATFVTDSGFLGPASVPDLCQSVVSRSDSVRLATIVRRARGTDGR